MPVRFLSMLCCSRELWCDGVKHCADESDEINCQAQACKNDEFQCETTRHCIPNSWKCDREADCVDATDELNCDGSVTAFAPQCSTKYRAAVKIPQIGKNLQDFAGSGSECPDLNKNYFFFSFNPFAAIGDYCIVLYVFISS